MRSVRYALILVVALSLGAFKHGTFVAASAPVLSAQTAIADGFDHTLLSVSTTIGSGTLYQSTSTNCGLTPTATQVKAGVTSAVSTTNQAVAASGTQNGNPGGLSPVTAYCTYFVHNAAGGDSNVVKTASITTNGQLTITSTFCTVATSCPCTTKWTDNPDQTAWEAVLTNVITFWQNNLAPTNNTNVHIQFGYTNEPINCGSAGAGGGSAYFFSILSYNTATKGVPAPLQA